MNGSPNQPDAANPAIASGLQCLHRWRGVADPERSMISVFAILVCVVSDIQGGTHKTGSAHRFERGR